MNGPSNEVFAAPPPPNGDVFTNGLHENGSNEHGTFELAPGAERHAENHAAAAPPANGGLNEVPGPSGVKVVPSAEGKVVMDYSTDFPKLPDAPVATAAVTGAWSKRPAIKSTEVTEVFKLSSNERASRGLGKQFGNVSDEQQKCNQVSQATGTKIELCEAKDQSLTILITGKRSNVEDARARLVRELQTQANTEVVVPKDYHGMIIGKQGDRLRQLEQEFLCRIFMPGRDEKTNDTIRIVGPNEYIGLAARRIKEIADEAARQGNAQLDVPKSFYPWIRGPFNETLDAIVAETGARVNIPPPSAKSDTIVITGLREGVEQAAKRIRAIYESKNKFNVRIKFPARGTSNEGAENGANGILPSNQVVITGRDTKCEAAKEALIALIPVTETVKVPAEYHSSFIGKGGETVRALMSAHAVRIKIPTPAEQSDDIEVTGVRENVQAALEDIRERVAEFDRQADDRKLRSHKVTIEVPLKYHQRLIGVGGASVRETSARHDVQINIPRSDSGSETITITGYETNANACKDEIEKLIEELESMFTQEISLDARFHPRLIGQRGRNLRKVQEDFGVEIRLPGRNDPNPNLVVIAGKTEDAVYDCIDSLRQQEEDYLADHVDRGQQYLYSRQEPEHQTKAKPQQVEIQGAPWQLEQEDFPTMGGGPAPAAAPQPGVWGQRRW
ncbi:KH domain-containing protein [Aphelenchoides avenae]|nr:KH domain-containing protein [Aphelenchus avenae]